MIDVIVSTAPSVDELNVSPTFSVAAPAAFRIAFETLDLAGPAVLVALEVDETVVLLVATALVTGGDVAVVVAAAGVGLLGEQRGVGFALVQARGHHANDVTSAGRGGFHLNERHDLDSLVGGAADEIDLLAFGQGDVGLLPIGTTAG